MHIVYTISPLDGQYNGLVIQYKMFISEHLVINDFIMYLK